VTSVRICVDLKALNESVMRETHPIPKVDNTLVQLYISGVPVFSKLDAKSRFWQIPLEVESLLTTFIMPYGRCTFNKVLFNKLPFRILVHVQ